MTSDYRTGEVVWVAGYADGHETVEAHCFQFLKHLPKRDDFGHDCVLIGGDGYTFRAISRDLFKTRNDCREFIEKEMQE